MFTHHGLEQRFQKNLSKIKNTFSVVFFLQKMIVRKNLLMVSTWTIESCVKRCVSNDPWSDVVRLRVEQERNAKKVAVEKKSHAVRECVFFVSIHVFLSEEIIMNPCWITMNVINLDWTNGSRNWFPPIYMGNEVLPSNWDSFSRQPKKLMESKPKLGLSTKKDYVI